METDISILRKSGHFYFALTRICHQSSPSEMNVPSLTFHNFREEGLSVLGRAPP